jgi:DeoR family fructose operon transcriptional repressor
VDATFPGLARTVKRMGVSGNLATEERLAWVRARLNVDGRIRIPEAARELGVSEMTIRRDLQELETTGFARRVRGGAVSLAPVGTTDSRSRARALSRIAAKLLPMVEEVGAVGLDASATIARLAGVIDSARDLTVVTNGLDTFQCLQGRPGIIPLLTGGKLDARTASLVGPLALATAGQVLLHCLLLSAAAVDPDIGPSEPSIDEAEVKRTLASVAETVVLAVDSSKLGSRSMAVSVPWDRISVMVTELDPGDTRLDLYRDRVAIM